MKRIVPCLLIFILLLAGLPAAAEACPSAPLTRLLPTIEGVVAPGVQGLNLRALPAIGAGTVLTLNSGTRFTVISGPSCNSGYNWWRVTVIGTGGTTGWIAEADWMRYFVQPDTGVEPHPCNATDSPWARIFLAPLCYFTH